MDGAALTREQRESAQGDLLRFTALNALSFEILAGQILILFARQVGASLSQIGLLSALLPFASIIQLGVAPLVNRFGPRAVMMVGWGARTAVAAALFFVPIAGARGGPAAATQLLLVVMGGFYFCRALGMSSWLPILQEIVPPQDRGQYISRQEWMRQASIVLIAVVTAGYLVGATSVGRYMHIIGVGVVAAAGSLVFLARVPNVGSMAEPLDREYFQRAMAPLRDGVFRHYLIFSVLLRMILTAYAPFLTVFLRESLGLSASGVIGVNTVGSLGAIAGLGIWGRLSDRMGAKPVVAISTLGVAGALLLYTLPDRSWAWTWIGVPSISALLGLFNGGLTVSLSKFELGFIPMEGRAHYVALNVTLAGVGSAASTFAAGALLQFLHPVHLRLGTWYLDRFDLFFGLAGILLFAPVMLRRSLPEERSRSVRALLERELRTRSRILRKILQRDSGDPARAED
jgi:MFS family permease